MYFISRIFCCSNYNCKLCDKLIWRVFFLFFKIFCLRRVLETSYLEDLILMARSFHRFDGILVWISWIVWNCFLKARNDRIRSMWYLENSWINKKGSSFFSSKFSSPPSQKMTAPPFFEQNIRQTNTYLLDLDENIWSDTCVMFCNSLGLEMEPLILVVSRI